MMGEVMPRNRQALLHFLAGCDPTKTQLPGV